MAHRLTYANAIPYTLHASQSSILLPRGIRIRVTLDDGDRFDYACLIPPNEASVEAWQRCATITTDAIKDDSTIIALPIHKRGSLRADFPKYGRFGYRLGIHVETADGKPAWRIARRTFGFVPEAKLDTTPLELLQEQRDQLELTLLD